MDVRKSVEAATGPMRWALAHTRPYAERLAKENFERQGFEAYLPMIVRMDKTTQKLRGTPFFPRHVFVRVDVDFHRWRAIYSTRGVNYIYGNGTDYPAVVPDEVVELVRAHEEAGLIKMMDPADLPCPYKKGDAVRVSVVLGGVVELVDAVFEERIDTKRVSLLTSWLGRQVVTEAHLAQVQSRAQVR